MTEALIAWGTEHSTYSSRAVRMVNTQILLAAANHAHLRECVVFATIETIGCLDLMFAYAVPIALNPRSMRGLRLFSVRSVVCLGLIRGTRLAP